MDKKLNNQPAKEKRNGSTVKYHGVLQKLNLLQIRGCFQTSQYGRHLKLFDKLPRRLTFRLADLVSESVLQSGHVFLGFTKDGQFVLSYTLQVETDEQTAYPYYVYRLHWWQFVPYRPLKKVAEVHLFGNQEITQDLRIAVCQWPTDDSRVLIYGSGFSHVQDAAQCYFTITAVPPLQPCSDCASVAASHNTEENSLPASASPVITRCLRHSFTIHTKYILVSPFPSFNPFLCMKIDSALIINTGDLLIFLRVSLDTEKPHSSQKLPEPPMKDVGSSGSTGSDPTLVVTSPSSISSDSQLSWSFATGEVSKDNDYVDSRSNTINICTERSLHQCCSDSLHHCQNGNKEGFFNNSSNVQCTCCICRTGKDIFHPNTVNNYNEFNCVLISSKRRLSKDNCTEDELALLQESSQGTKEVICAQQMRIQQKRLKLSTEEFYPLSPKGGYDNSCSNDSYVHSENLTCHAHREPDIVKLHCWKHQNASEYTKANCLNCRNSDSGSSKSLNVKPNDGEVFSQFPISSSGSTSPVGVFNSEVLHKQKRNTDKTEDHSDSLGLIADEARRKKVSNLLTSSTVPKKLSSQDIIEDKASLKLDSSSHRTEIPKRLCVKKEEESIKENISPSSRKGFGGISKSIKDKEQRTEVYIKESEKTMDKHLEGSIINSSSQWHRSCSSSCSDSSCPPQSSMWCVSQSLHCFIQDNDQINTSSQHQEAAEEDSTGSEYHNTLQLEVYGSGYVPLKMVHHDEFLQKSHVLGVQQMAFDIEVYAHEMAQKLCAEAGKKYLAFNDYDVQIIDLCPVSETVVILVLMLVQATVGRKGVAKAIRSAERRLYQAGFKFKWNINTGIYCVIDTEELKEIDPYDRMHDRPYGWNPGQKSVQHLQKQWYIPRTFARSVSVLTNEAVIRGSSLKVLWAPTHHVAIVL